LLNADEREILFFLGTLAWRSFARAGLSAHPVTKQELKLAEQDNQSSLFAIEDSTDDHARVIVETMLSACAQPDLLRYVIGALSLTQDSDVRQECLGIMMLDLKTAIDCLNGVSFEGQE
jgi:hypothetical protein